MSIVTESPPLVADRDSDALLFDLAQFESDSAVEDSGDMHYLLQSIRTGLPMFIGDIMSSVGSVFIALFVVSFLPLGPMDRFVFAAIQFVLTHVLINTVLGLYPAVGLHPAHELRALTISGLVTGCCMAVAALVIGDLRSPYFALSIVAAVCMVLQSFPLRWVCRAVSQRFSWWGHPAVIIGRMPSEPELNQALRNGELPGVRLLGQFGDRESCQDGAECQWLGNLSEAEEFCDRRRVFWAFISCDSMGDRSLDEFSRDHGLRFRQILAIEQNAFLPNLWNSPIDLGGLAGVHVRERLLIPSHRYCKRLFDIVFSLFLLVVLSPMLLSVAALVKFTSKGPVFFGHRRLGYNGRHFKSWKFRTMVTNADEMLEQYLANNPAAKFEWEEDQKLKKDPRVTYVGNFLRKWSLDELPQLWNVLCGEMSMVGPRPIVDAEIDKYGSAFPLFVRVRPGITGLWQVSGRNNTSYKQRVDYDRYYVRNWSFWLDAYIAVRTVRTVLFREGAY